MKRLLFALFLSALVVSVISTLCHTSSCDKVTCRNPTSCGENQVLERGGYCLCCKYCKQLIGLNEDCSSVTDPLGESSTTIKCKEGLACYDVTKTCRPNDEVYKPQN